MSDSERDALYSDIDRLHKKLDAARSLTDSSLRLENSSLSCDLYSAQEKIKNLEERVSIQEEHLKQSAIDSLDSYKFYSEQYENLHKEYVSLQCELHKAKEDSVLAKNQLNFQWFLVLCFSLSTAFVFSYGPAFLNPMLWWKPLALFAVSLLFILFSSVGGFVLSLFMIGFGHTKDSRWISPEISFDIFSVRSAVFILIAAALGVFSATWMLFIDLHSAPTPRPGLFHALIVHFVDAVCNNWCITEYEKRFLL